MGKIIKKYEILIIIGLTALSYFCASPLATFLVNLPPLVLHFIAVYSVWSILKYLFQG